MAANVATAAGPAITTLGRIRLMQAAPKTPMERRMKSKAECLQHAVMCEQMAMDADEQSNRSALLATARQWRTLAEHAPAADDVVAQSDDGGDTEVSMSKQHVKSTNAP